MDRNFLYDIQTVSNVKQLDFLSGDVTDFKFKRSVKYHQVNELEVGRFDLIAQLYYGNVDWWWILAVANDVLNPLDELVEGVSIVIPDVSDIWDFFQERRRR